MPRFSKRQIKEVKEPGITDAVVEKYQKYVESIDGNSVGVLKFRESRISPSPARRCALPATSSIAT